MGVHPSGDAGSVRDRLDAQIKLLATLRSQQEDLRPSIIRLAALERREVRAYTPIPHTSRTLIGLRTEH